MIIDENPNITLEELNRIFDEIEKYPIKGRIICISRTMSKEDSDKFNKLLCEKEKSI